MKSELVVNDRLRTLLPGPVRRRAGRRTSESNVAVDETNRWQGGGHDLFEILSPTDGAPDAAQSESDPERAADDEGVGDHTDDHDCQGERDVEYVDAGAGVYPTHDMKRVPLLHIISNHVECPLYHKEIMRLHLN